MFLVEAYSEGMVSICRPPGSDAALRSLGYIPTVSEPRLCVKLNINGSQVYIAVHVDDLGIAASNKSLVKAVIAQL